MRHISKQFATGKARTGLDSNNSEARSRNITQTGDPSGRPRSLRPALFLVFKNAVQLNDFLLQPLYNMRDNCMNFRKLLKQELYKDKGIRASRFVELTVASQNGYLSVANGADAPAQPVGTHLLVKWAHGCRESAPDLSHGKGKQPSTWLKIPPGAEGDQLLRVDRVRED
ncbi:unnamed protein product [Prorocentrum cordatum]|uniref:Uncharacterized protein n=1 Tax=Prorocentrum cordatum TaxID=2364126 RepID=A0ABN9WVJ1_9DINO|nr:unnamed protein product [Polarella glacialis]